MADDANSNASTTPKATMMPRAVHELSTGKKPEEMLTPGTLITDEVAKQHKLDDKTLAALTSSGAIEMVEVLKG